MMFSISLKLNGKTYQIGDNIFFRDLSPIYQYLIKIYWCFGKLLDTYYHRDSLETKLNKINNKRSSI